MPREIRKGLDESAFEGLDIDASDAGDLEPFIGYIRVSTWKEEKISPELQRDAIAQWAKRTGRRIVAWVEDLDVSGRHFKRKIMKCIESVEAGQARGVAVWRYSRFGRDRTGNAMNLARLQQAGGELESATEPVDASTAIGRFQRGMILEFGAFESDRAGEQWRETHDHRRYKLQLPAHGRRRFGYIWHRRYDPATGTLQKERYEADPDLGPVVADLYRDYVAGDGFSILCGKLNRAGHRTTQGRLWHTETLSRYMDSGFAAGLLRVHNPECRCRKTDGHCRNRIYIQGAQEELIDFDLWQAYLQRRKEVRETVPRSRTGIYELTSLVKCSGCKLGTALNAARRNGRNEPGFAYRCSLRAKAGATACDGILIHRTEVENEVFRWLTRVAAEGIDAAPSTAHHGPERDLAAEQAANIAARARTQAEIDKQRTALARLRAEHAANPDDFGPGEYEEAADLIREKRREAQALLDSIPETEPLPDRAEFIPLVIGTVEEWDTLDTRGRNMMLRKLIRRVAITRHGAGNENHEIAIHPVWEPDPWPAPQPTTRIEATER
ncbi:recombinase family protein [Streptomyces sp. TRM66268-LWL]|uniref:Recombinase family protein n=1 Tax=Streptomyces polyasparticus TaxID=2767826 RepID=A0ABR7SEW5_9ACTN|nr:recombinase family protein [Streptomyces polyasparticus]MBC9714046.1 recombinase family protein [Streptomyces polyasparticus]